MSDFAEIKSIHDFPSLIKYLRKELGWPVDEEQVDDLTFEYTPQELNLDARAAVKIRAIKQLRPLTGNQPWGIFWIDFEPKRLPVVVMRRILGALVRKQRGGRTHQAAWDLHDLMFISATGTGDQRLMSFAHFQETEGTPQLRTFYWDAHETHFFYIKNLNLDALRWPENPADAAAWRAQWSQAFTAAHRETISTSQALASRMARLASAIRLLVLQTVEAEQEGGPFHRLYAEFKRVLIHDLEVDDFADMYAQTVTYGLFTARAMPFTAAAGAAPDLPFDLEHVAAFIPPTNPFLRDLFAACIRADLDDNEVMDLEGLGVGELVTMLQQANMESILQDFGRQTRGEDPVIHFYESFLREYDAEKKVKRGVFYTPDPVVSFIVRSVDALLRTEFNCPDGLATPSLPPPNPTRETRMPTKSLVSDLGEVPAQRAVGAFSPIILDPACGTGTFLKYVIEQIYNRFVEKNRSHGQAEVRRLWNEYVPKHLLPRLYGFELLAAPYSVAHMKLGLKLRETGYDFGSDERLRVYLTNTLQWVDEVPRTATEFLAHESEEAGRVKSQTPVTVVIGNPPYANFGMMNRGNWISELLEEYKRGLNEKKLNLDDDFIKFIRFGQWLIEQSGKGVLAFITNNTYIDGLTHRRMRESILESFDEIYIMNLHGSIYDNPPNNLQDENVFDIQQGVCISFLVRHEKNRKNDETKIFYVNLWGTRRQKYESLITNNLASTEWTRISPKSPNFFFIPKEETYLDEYKQYLSVSEIFDFSNSALQTKKDALTIHFDVSSLKKVLSDLQKLDTETLRREYELGPDGRDWGVHWAKQDVVRNKGEIFNVAYRPFDIRWSYFTGKSKGFLAYPRADLTEQLLKPNLALATLRQIAGVEDTCEVLATRHAMTDRSMFSTHGTPYIFPIYIYPSSIGKQKTLFDSDKRKHNFTLHLLNNLKSLVGIDFIPDGTGDLRKTFGPEDVFHYMYAVFHSPTYRSRYAEFLKIDFPRLPLTSNLDLFRRLCGLGEELVSLHLLEHSVLEKPIIKFTGWTENGVAKGYPKYQDGMVLINEQQGFEGVPSEVWEFHVGGYQVCQKWLKDRRGRQLSAEDIVHYQKIVVALKETIKLMAQVDTVIESAGGWPIK
jgi:hypothetical protein